jgi:hypothetical protein
LPSHRHTLRILFLIILIVIQAKAQTIGTSLPTEISKSEKYLFYLHGAVVTLLGNNAINQSMPEWGPYEYLNILDSLRNRGFNVISENRQAKIHDSVYVSKLVKQIDTLFHAGVKPENIVVLGASAGWHIAIHASARLMNTKLSYVIMGGCWPETYKDYFNLQLNGRFLSIIEATDPHGTCLRIFETRKNSFKEIKLNTGLSHGFIYKGYRAWIDPVVQWFEGQN